MARTAAVLSALVVLLLGGVVAVDDPGMLLTLVGAALCALGCVRARRASTDAGTALVVPGRRARSAAGDTSRQHHPDAAGRPRPRAPGRLSPAM
jgi:Family of unknown function (DUF6412)